jgi:hypothetical protein
MIVNKTEANVENYDKEKDSKIDRIFNILYEIQEIQDEEHKLIIYLENQIIEPLQSEKEKESVVVKNNIGILNEIINCLVRLKNNEDNHCCLIKNIAKEFNYESSKEVLKNE